jgi:ubiquinone/menaquinone biosynthesis C-methylase UbiE
VSVPKDKSSPEAGRAQPFVSRETWYERTILPYLLDFACNISPIQKQREKIIPRAQGRVLEVGIGTGLNLAFYDRSRIKNIVGVDPALKMHQLAIKRGAKAGLSIEMICLSAEKLPLPAACFETIVSTYTLCSIEDPVSALKEMRRVLAPGGKLLFSEHGRAPDPSVLKWQTAVQPYWGKIAGGCRLNRDIPALLTAAGFLAQVESRYIPGPRIFSYHYWGEATAA